MPNDQLLKIAPQNLPLEMAFRMADDVLRQGVQGISELITQPGLINVDFAHIRRLMQMGGASLMSIGYGEGENKAVKAVKHALNHPLLESACVDTAAGVIANFTGGADMGFLEVTEALSYLQTQTGTSTEIIPGVINDDRMEGRAQVILIITGLGGTPLEDVMPGVRKQSPAEQPAQPVQPVPAVLNYTPAPSMRPQAAPAQARSPLAVLSAIAGHMGVQTMAKTPLARRMVFITTAKAADPSEVQVLPTRTIGKTCERM